MTICFGGKESELISDSDLAGDIDGRKYTSGYLVTHSGGVVAWQSRLQNSVPRLLVVKLACTHVVFPSS
jgi:hypothetical protein